MFPENKIITRNPPAELDLDSAIEQLRLKFGVPKVLVDRMVTQESGGNVNAKSFAGATGRFQVMPATLRGISRETGKNLDINNPLDNAYAGLYLLRQNYDRFRSNAPSDRAAWMRAVAGYHGNPNNVEKDLKAGGIGIPDQGDGLINTRDHVYRIFAGTKPEDFAKDSPARAHAPAVKAPAPGPTTDDINTFKDRQFGTSIMKRNPVIPPAQPMAPMAPADVPETPATRNPEPPATPMLPQGQPTPWDTTLATQRVKMAQDAQQEAARRRQAQIRVRNQQVAQAKAKRNQAIEGVRKQWIDEAEATAKHADPDLARKLVMAAWHSSSADVVKYAQNKGIRLPEPERIASAMGNVKGEFAFHAPTIAEQMPAPENPQEMAAQNLSKLQAFRKANRRLPTQSEMQTLGMRAPGRPITPEIMTRAANAPSVLETPADRQERIARTEAVKSAQIADELEKKPFGSARRLLYTAAAQTGPGVAGELADLGGNLIQFATQAKRGSEKFGDTTDKAIMDTVNSFHEIGSYLRGGSDVPAKTFAQTAVKTGAGFIGAAEKYGIIAGNAPFWAVMGGEAALKFQDASLDVQAKEIAKGIVLGLALQHGPAAITKALGKAPGAIGQFARELPTTTHMGVAATGFGTAAAVETYRNGGTPAEILGAGLGAGIGAAALSAREAVKESAPKIIKAEGSPEWLRQAAGRATGKRPVVVQSEGADPRFASVYVDPKNPGQQVTREVSADEASTLLQRDRPARIVPEGQFNNVFGPKEVTPAPAEPAVAPIRRQIEGIKPETKTAPEPVIPAKPTPPAEIKPEAPAAQEPIEAWQRTRGEYVQSLNKTLTDVYKKAGQPIPPPELEKAAYRHEQIIKEAVKAGEPVPAEVLADYPDLKPPVASTSERAATVLKQLDEGPTREGDPYVTEHDVVNEARAIVDDLPAEQSKRIQELISKYDDVMREHREEHGMRMEGGEAEAESDPVASIPEVKSASASDDVLSSAKNFTGTETHEIAAAVLRNPEWKARVLKELGAGATQDRVSDPLGGALKFRTRSGEIVSIEPAYGHKQPPTLGNKRSGIVITREAASIPEGGAEKYYHGGDAVVTELKNEPMYAVEHDKEFAEGYSTGRHGAKTPQVTELTINPSAKFASQDELIAAIKKAGLWDDYMSGEGDVGALSQADMAIKPKVMSILKEQGFDGVKGANDFGFRSDFEEVPVTVAFDAKKSYQLAKATPPSIPEKNIGEAPAPPVDTKPDILTRKGEQDVTSAPKADPLKVADTSGEGLGTAPPKPAGEEAIVNPIDRNASQEEKAKALRKLSDENVPIVEELLAKIKEQTGLPGAFSHKLPERIILKANRPSIKTGKPWHDVEHVRDSLRFKAPIDSFKQFTDAVRTIISDPRVEVIKLDTGKMMEPKEWGWRFAALDIRLPNGQLVEFYSPFKELDDKAVKGPNHELFEKWRDQTPEYIDEHREEYWKDILESNARNEVAWKAALQRLGMDDAAARAAWTKEETSLASLTGEKLSLRSSGITMPGTQAPSLPRTIERSPSAASSVEPTTARPSSALETNSVIGVPASIIRPEGAEVPAVKQEDVAALRKELEAVKKKIREVNGADLGAANDAVVAPLQRKRDQLQARIDAATPAPTPYNAAIAADDAWQAELDRLKIDRWNEASRGTLHSELRRLYEAKVAADAARSEAPAPALSDETPDRPAEIGKPFIVFRVGRPNGKLTNRNAANAAGVADFLADADDIESSAGSNAGTHINAYQVTVDKPFSDYQHLEGRGARTSAGVVGREDQGSGRVRYSFPSEGFTAKLLSSTPVSDVEKQLPKGYFGVDLNQEAAAIRQTVDVAAKQEETKPNEGLREQLPGSAGDAGEEVSTTRGVGSVGVGAVDTGREAEQLSEPRSAGGTGTAEGAIGAGDVPKPVEKRTESDVSGGDSEERVSEPEPTAVEQTVKASKDQKRNALLHHDYRIDPTKLDFGGKKEKFRLNVDAIRTLQAIVAEGRDYATPEEQEKLVRYVGWGGLPEAFNRWNTDAKWKKEHDEVTRLLGGYESEEYQRAMESTKNAHYTSPEIVGVIWKMLERLGFPGGRILEPGVGTGNFFGMMPTDIHGHKATTLKGIDIDPLTGKIAQLLYPSSSVNIQGYQDYSVADNFFDLAVSNVPFSSTIQIADKRYAHLKPMLHDYYFLKSLDKVRPGGMVAFITSTGTMDRGRPEIREAIAEKADLVAAFRLPDTAFKKNAGTEVTTDLIILRKKVPGAEESTDKWIETPTTKVKGGKIALNEYYVAHPENMLGTPALSHKMYGPGSERFTLHGGPDFPELLQKAIESLPVDVYRSYKREVAEEMRFPAPDEIKQGALYVDNGKLFRKDKGELNQLDANKAVVSRVEGMIKIRGAVRNLFLTELSQGKGEVGKARTALNDAYDAFTKKFGFLNKKDNAGLFAKDPDAPVLLKLERPDAAKTSWVKAPIFTKSIVKTYEKPTKAANLGDALSISLNETAGIDMSRMAELLSITPDEIEEQIIAAGLAFRDPINGWQVKDEYLSGNVKKKLQVAQEAAKTDSLYEPNVKALEEVVREKLPDVDYVDIDARLGANWIPASDIADFAAGMTQAQPKDFKVTYLPTSGTWIVQSDSHLASYGTQATSVWGTERAPFLKVLQAALDDKRIVIYDKSGDTSTINRDATEAANAKVRDLKSEFKDWVWNDDARRQRLHRYYNDNFVNMVNRQFEGQHLTLAGLSDEWQKKLHPHIKDAVWRIINNGKALVAYEVGTGKTAIMAISAMELKRLGLVRKPMIATLNAALPGVAAEVREMYPNINLLVLGEKDLDAKQRNAFMADISTSDYDLIIVGHSHVNMLPVLPDTQAQYLREEMNELEAAIVGLEEAEGISGQERKKSGNRVVKQLAAAKEKLEERIKEALGSKKDNVVYFEQTGVDMLYVDEAHAYKSVPVYTKRGQVKGIPTTRSDRATNMLMITRWLQENNNNRGVVFATGTPISNSIPEIYTLQRYLQAPELKERGIDTFDAWANLYGDTTAKLEYKATGEYKQTVRFNQFTNLPELRALLGDVMDVKFADQLPGFKRPARKDHVTAVPMSDEQWQYLVQDIRPRAVALQGGGWGNKGKGADNMLAIGTDARKSALDMRLVVAGAADNPDSKINVMVRKVLKVQEDNPGKTQMIFSDLGFGESEWGFSLVDDVIKKLVKGGIPKEKIINFNALTDSKRGQAIKDLKSAKALVGIGSSQKMGTGINAQDHLLNLHHIDAPYVPAYLEQRNGRGWRMGNQNPVVHIDTYTTEGSFDVFMWQTVTNKSNFIDKFMRGDVTQRSIRDDDAEELSNAQIMAVTAGNPDLLFKMQLEDEVEELGRGARRHKSQQARLRDSIKNAEGSIKNEEKRIEEITKDLNLYESEKGKPFSLTVGEKAYSVTEDAKPDAVTETKKKAGKALQKAVAIWFQKRQELKDTYQRRELQEHEGQGSILGNYRGFEIQAHASGRVTLVGQGEYTVATEGEDPLTPLRSADAVLRNGPSSKLRNATQRIEHDKSEIEKAKAQIGKPFRDQALLEKKKQALADVSKKLEEAPADVREAFAEESGRPMRGPARRAERPKLTMQEAMGEGRQPMAARKAQPDIFTRNRGEAGAIDVDLLTLGVRPFVKDIAGKAGEAAAGTREIAESIKSLLAPPSRSTAAQATSRIVRADAAEMARQHDIADRSLSAARKYFAKQTPQSNYAFIDRMEQGLPQANPKLQAFADTFREMLDDRRDRVQALGTGKLDQFIEDYFPHIWKDTKRARNAFQQMSAKRPFEGSKSFLKRRKLPLTADGLKLGLEPVSNNPVDLAVLKLREMDKYVMAHRVMNEMKANGSLKFYKSSQRLPEGWTQIDDRVSTVFSRSDKGELILRGKYAAPDPAAKIVNNYLSPGLSATPFRVPFKAWRATSNFLNQFQLGFSAFHAGFTTIDAMVSRTAIGLEDILRHGKFVRGLGTIASTPFSPVTNLIQGSRMLKEWYTPGAGGQEIAKYVDAMVAGGGRARMDRFYTNSTAQRFMDALRQGNILGAAVRLPGTAVELLAKPVMEWLVPRQKMGVFADMAKRELERLGPDATQAQIRHAMAKAWDSVDNRMGQMVYDNLFWNKITKDLAMASVRSVGWNVGTLREVGGGLFDFATVLRDVTIGAPKTVYEPPPGSGGKKRVVDRERRFEFTHRMAYVIALPLVVGTLGAIIQYLFTGKGPQELKDYFFPKTGNVDENGNPERISLPSYMKDVFHAWEEPLKVATSKLHPLIGIISEMLRNEDYYGTKIRNEDDPYIQQLKDAASHAGKSVLPFSIRGYQKELERGGSLTKRILPFVGITPAPSYINKSPAEKMLGEIAKAELKKGARTKEEFERSRLTYQLESKARKGEDITGAISTAIQQGKLRPNAAQNILRDAKQSPLQLRFKKLSLPDALEVWDVMTPDERTEIKDILATKASSVDNLPVDQQPAIRQKLADIGLKEGIYRKRPDPPVPHARRKPPGLGYAFQEAAN